MLWNLSGSSSGTNSLVAINSCTCEGHTQIYECRVTGNGATIWKGSALDCSSSRNEIIILSSDSVNRSRICNNGAIAGRLVRRENDSYLTQLSVSVSSEVISRNISCYHEVGHDLVEIGTLYLPTTTCKCMFTLYRYSIITIIRYFFDPKSLNHVY